MRPVAQLLRELDAHGITLAADGETLRVRAAGTIPDALRAELSARKPELLRRLTITPAPRGTPARAATSPTRARS